jgi:BTB/POZ domain
MDEMLRFDHSKLLENGLLADVIFTFPSPNEGDAGAPNTTDVKAHKAFLISASPVFHTMFCGSLPPPKEEVAIKDIRREDFTEVLRHIYGSEAMISFENVFGVWYAAKKYLLAELTKKCADFVHKGVNSSNVLDVFQAVQLFENYRIDQKCLVLLMERPQQYIVASEIVKMNKDAFRKFIHYLENHCSVEYLKKIALEWFNFQKQTKYCCFSDKIKQILDEEFQIFPKIFEQKEENLALDIDYFGSTLFQNMDNDCVIVDFGDGIYDMQGIGIYVGIDPDDVVTPCSSEWIVVKVNQIRLSFYQPELKKTVHVQQELTTSIFRVMFEKIHIKGKIRISIEFPDERRRAINPLSWKKKSLGRMTLPAEMTCVAYLIGKYKQPGEICVEWPWPPITE